MPKQPNQQRTNAFNVALWYLSRKSRSVFEIESKLKNRGFNAGEIEKAIAKLKSLKFLDDSKYVENYIRNSISVKPKGKLRLRQELIKKGIAKEIIEQKLDLFSADKSFELAIDLAQKKYKLVKNLSRDKIYSRVVGFLLRRGFSYDEAKKAYNLIQNP